MHHPRNKKRGAPKKPRKPSIRLVSDKKSGSKFFRCGYQTLRGLRPFLYKHLVHSLVECKVTREQLAAADQKSPEECIVTMRSTSRPARGGGHRRGGANPYANGLAVHASLQRAVNRRTKTPRKMSVQTQTILKALMQLHYEADKSEVKVMCKSARMATSVDLVAKSKHGHVVIVELKTTRADGYHSYKYILDRRLLPVGAPLTLISQCQVDLLQAFCECMLFQAHDKANATPKKPARRVEDTLVAHTPSLELTRLYRVPVWMLRLREQISKLMTSTT